MRRGTEGSNGRPDADDVAGNLGCAAGGVLNVAGDLARRRPLLLHCRGDRGSDLVDLADGLADVPDSADRRRRHLLHAGDLRANFVGGLCGLVGEAFDLGGDHREAAASFAGARGFDSGVERQQVGLRSDHLNQIDHDADAAGVVGQTLHGGVGCAGFIDGLAGNLGRSNHLAADFGDR